MKRNHSALAKYIIRTNIYCTLATADKKGTAWASPVTYAIDDAFTFYFISQPSSRHTKNLLSNPNIACAIFDSHQKEGTCVGVQIAGKVYQLKDEELPEACRWYKSNYVEVKPETFQGNNPYRFFKIIPKHIYILDPDAATDKRAEVFI